MVYDPGPLALRAASSPAAPNATSASAAASSGRSWLTARKQPVRALDMHPVFGRRTGDEQVFSRFQEHTLDRNRRGNHRHAGRHCLQDADTQSPPVTERHHHARAPREECGHVARVSRDFDVAKRAEKRERCGQRSTHHCETDSFDGREQRMDVVCKVNEGIAVEGSTHRAEKRGGGWDKLTFDESLAPSAERSIDLVALDDALKDLLAFDPRQSQIVELRFFGGLTNEEIGEVLDVSPRTVKREWRIAKAWLRREIMPEEDDAARQ
jgi:RNA polymerase sigma factor (sigma-70 family)